MTVYPYDPATNELADPIVVGPEVSGLAHRLRIGATIYGEVAHSRKPYLVEDLSRERRFGATAEWMRSAYVVPLAHGTQLLGVIAVQSDMTDAFSQAERESLDRLASFVGDLAMTTVRLNNYEQAIRRFDRFQMLAQSLTKILDSKELLREIVGTAREMLDAQMSVLLDIDPDAGDLNPIAWSGITDDVAALMRSRYKADLKGFVKEQLPAIKPVKAVSGEK